MRTASTLLTLVLLLAAAPARAEDQALRNQAVHLLDQARLASRMAGPTNIRTEVAFTATERDQPLTAGTYTRTRSAAGALRQDVVFGDFHASRIQQDANVADQGPWLDLPYSVRALMEFVPYATMRFDPSDIIQSIEPGQVLGQHSTCIQFVTVRGEDRNPGEICVSDADRTILAWHDSRRSWQATRYTLVHGGLEPAEFSYKEGSSFSLTATVTFTLLDAEPVDALTIPSDWARGAFCKTFQTPVPTSTPQPPAPGTANLPVINVGVHAHVTAQGSVTGATILKPARPDLDAEALALVATWRYQPGSCEGRLQDWPLDVLVHFQGR